MWAALLALSAPAIASSPVSLADLVTVTDLSGLAAAPDGRWIAFRTEQPQIDRNQVETRWYVAPLDRRSPPRAVFDGGAALHTGPGLVLNEHPVWLPDSSGFLVRAAIDGAVQVWRVELTGENAQRITDSDGDVLAFQLSADGRVLTYSAGPSRAETREAEQAIRDRGARVDASVDLAVGVLGGAQGPFGPRSVRLTGQWFDRRDLLAGGMPRFFSQALGGKAAPAGGGPLPKDYVLPDPVIEAEICRTTDCRKGRIEATVAVPGTSRILVATADPTQRQTLNWWDGRRLMPIHRADGLASGGRVEYQPCAVTPRAAVCVLASADRPPRLASIDLASGETQTLFDPNELLRLRVSGRARDLSWTDRRGHQFDGKLYLPSGAAPAGGFPLVVQYYWCEGFLRGGQGDELPFLVLADHGIAALCINRSLSTAKAGERFADLRIAASGIAAVIDRLAKTGLVDRERVGMQGLSFGSEATMWVLNNTSLLRAASIASGQFAPMSYWFYADPERDFAKILAEIWHMSDPDTQPAAWRAASAVRGDGRITTPLLMQLPESEARWSLELFRKRQRAGAPVELYAFPGAAHVKSAPRQLLAASERNLAWFLFWLKGERLLGTDIVEHVARPESGTRALLSPATAPRRAAQTGQRVEAR